MATLPLNVHPVFRNGTATAIDKYAGVANEVVVDSTNKRLVILSGTAGTNYPQVPSSRTITAGDGVKLVVDGTAGTTATLNKDFTVKADVAGFIAANAGLKADTNGKAAVDISLSYAAATGKVSVLAADGTTELASVIIPSHTSALQSAAVEVASAASPVNSQVTGTYLHFVWLLSNGTTVDNYVDATTLVDVYTAGNGLQTTSGNEHQFEVKASNGIEVSSAGVAAKVKTGETILVCDANGLSIDTSNLTTATNQVIVSTDTNNILTAGTDGGAFLKLAADGLLTINTNGELEFITDYGTIPE